MIIHFIRAYLSMRSISKIDVNLGSFGDNFYLRVSIAMMYLQKFEDDGARKSAAAATVTAIEAAATLRTRPALCCREYITVYFTRNRL